jgi:predicted AAA+ superfamily ATPase
MRGPIFEAFVISEIYKQIQNRGLDAQIYYWRDSNDREIDLLIENGPEPFPVEIKSARTVNREFFKVFDYWKKTIGEPEAKGALIYGGDAEYMQRDVHVLPAALL